jgi:D-lactate dehydrogenase (cytochrome)
MTAVFSHPPDESTIKSAISDLSRISPGRCSANTATLAQHASTLTGLPHQPPDAVVFPNSIEEVQAVVAIARKYRLPLIPFGSGTSLEGQVNAPAGGISVDLSRMNNILRLGTDDLDVTVEPGVTLDQLNTALRDTGLFFPVDPGASNATLGGMASTRASGTTTVRYGAVGENVLAMKVVLADGTLISTGTRARKSAAGYDLTHLFIGAEGTLGIIVELTLRLRPRPELVLAGIATFIDVASAARATITAVQSGLAVQRIELLDAAMLKIVNLHSGTAIPDRGPALFVEIAGTPAEAAEHLSLFTGIVAAENGDWIGGDASDHDRRRLWKARHDAFWSVRSAFPGKSFLVTDVCVPVSRLADCLSETVADLASNRLTAPIVGHVGDGNFHTILVVDGSDSAACSGATAYLDRLAARAIAMEGTCTGEHGIGQGKAKHLADEAGAAVDVMRRVKASLDPDGLMNPGKIF